jgi:SAM-dependent methyltransferase
MKFEDIYKNKLWNGNGILSGPGSCPIGASDYINFLRKFKDYKVLDLGCGDCKIYGGDIFFKNYVGVDGVNIPKYSTFPPNLNFYNSEIKNFDFESVTFNLVILKDVFQHLSNNSIFEILIKLKELSVDAFIITNDLNIDNDNIDCNDGDYRRLNMNNDPFNLKYDSNFIWKSRNDNIIKETLIIKDFC